MSVEEAPPIRLGIVRLLVAAVVLSAAVNVILALRSRQASASAALTDHIRNIAAKTVDMRPEMIRLAGAPTPTLLYVFATTCDWCARNSSNINAIVAGAAGRLRVVGIAIPSPDLRDYLRHNPMRFPVFTGVSQEVLTQLGATETPDSILVDPLGRVERRWPGAYVGGTLLDIEQTLHVILPGISPITTNAPTAQGPQYCFQGAGEYSPGAVLCFGGWLRRCRAGTWTRLRRCAARVPKTSRR